MATIKDVKMYCMWCGEELDVVPTKNDNGEVGTHILDHNQNECIQRLRYRINALEQTVAQLVEKIRP